MANYKSAAILLSIVVVFMSIIARIFSTPTVHNISKTTARAVADKTIMPENTSFKFNETEKLPAFFLSHGGPTFGDRVVGAGSNIGAFDTVRKVGQSIKNQIKPDFVLVISAHWQSSGPDLVEISIPDGSHSGVPDAADFTSIKGGFQSVSKPIAEFENSLIYDFYGFPNRMYKQQFHTVASIELAKDIRDTLIENGFKSRLAVRGIDHGVWVPGRVAFADPDSLDTKKLDLDVPLLQVSLTSSSKFDIHYKLGQVLSKYRKLNGVLIFSGMSVHNLGGFRQYMHSDDPTQKIPSFPYTTKFNKLLTEFLTKPSPSEVLDALHTLETDPELIKLTKDAHPTNEHFLPVVVGAGAASSGDDKCTELYSAGEISLGWNIYQWKP